MLWLRKVSTLINNIHTNYKLPAQIFRSLGTSKDNLLRPTAQNSWLIWSTVVLVTLQCHIPGLRARVRAGFLVAPGRGPGRRRVPQRAPLPTRRGGRH